MTASPEGPEPEITSRLTRALGPQYEVRGLLGRGGFAEVYEVWDKSLERRLAVKVLRPDIAWTPGMLARFKQEAKAVAHLAHPNILPIHFVGEGEGLVYYAMPFVEGQSLGDVIRSEGRLDPDRALSIARSVFDALEHAHEKGLIHRDIKPENIMIDKASGRPMLVDFGIAKQLEQGGTTGKGLTQTGFVVGTPHYMSPEQALGQGGVDARSDIYAMGAVLFQMVTGTPPFDGETSQEIVSAHITQPPPLASAVDAKIPRWLSDVIVRCLAKKPADRFSTASHAARALTAGRMSGPQEQVTAERVARAVDTDRTVAMPSGQRTAARSPQPQPYSPPEAAGVSRNPRSRAGMVVVLALLIIGAGAGTFWFVSRPVVVIQNRLVEPVEIVIEGEPRRTIEPGGEAKIEVTSGTPRSFNWVMVQPTTPQGIPMGLKIGGSMAVTPKRGTQRIAINGNAIEPPAFAPLVTNAGSTPLGITVNAGLAGSMSCSCVIPPGGTRVRIGYYPLYQNSSVRAEDPRRRQAAFGDLGPDVDQVTGTVGLRFEDKDFRN